jgi:hypothetical protein
MGEAKWALSRRVEARRFARDYMDRLEIYLRTLDREQQVNFLCELLRLWLCTHIVLSQRIEDGRPVNPRVNLDNYLETIIEINERLQKAADDLVQMEIDYVLEGLGAWTHRMNEKERQ